METRDPGYRGNRCRENVPAQLGGLLLPGFHTQDGGQQPVKPRFSSINMRVLSIEPQNTI